ncbi:MAG: HAD family hydrolase [Candidatus Hodarchaeota archaeon]
MIKAVIFDLVKTLGEFELISEYEASIFLRNKGYEIYPQTWRSAFGFVLFIDYPKYGYDSHESLFNQVFNRLELDVDESTVIELSNIFRNRPFKLFSNSLEAVKRAKNAGLKTAIATSTPKPFFISGIEPIEEHLDYVCTGYEAGYEKSNPQIYVNILRHLCVEPDEAIVIGDNPILDIVNAKQLGLWAIQIINEEKPSELADRVVKNVLDAVKIALHWI